MSVNELSAPFPQLPVCTAVPTPLDILLRLEYFKSPQARLSSWLKICLSEASYGCCGRTRLVVKSTSWRASKKRSCENSPCVCNVSVRGDLTRRVTSVNPSKCLPVPRHKGESILMVADGKRRSLTRNSSVSAILKGLKRQVPGPAIAIALMVLGQKKASSHEKAVFASMRSQEWWADIAFLQSCCKARPEAFLRQYFAQACECRMTGVRTVRKPGGRPHVHDAGELEARNRDSAEKVAADPQYSVTEKCGRVALSVRSHTLTVNCDWLSSLSSSSSSFSPSSASSVSLDVPQPIDQR
ncbi:hypothetical protein KC336_g63 [Hortaea werneckii]|nr:hypothetical protein KC336_g63 [Hortaea werneckii]